jgi:hypothetical protein
VYEKIVSSSIRMHIWQCPVTSTKRLMFCYEILEILVIDLYKNGIKVSSNIVGDHKEKSMITSNLPENWRVEEENTMTLRHQAANLMSCNDEHNLETPKTAQNYI